MAILSKINLKNTLAIIREKINNFCAKPSKKRLAIIFTLTFALFLIPAYRAHAGLPDPIGWAMGGISSIIQTALFAGPYILIWLFTGIAVLFVGIATFLVNAALSPAIYMAIINSPGIDRGWTIMRDTANLFFILILIFIALATTLRLQSYSAKTWIPKLLFGAVFINFSKTITMFIIDIGNMFMYGAISWMGQGIENTGIGKLTETAFKLFIDLEPLHKIIGGITLTVLAQGFVGFMFNLVLALTLLGFGILLLIRVSMLAILTIFSPIAFMLHAWPNAGKYAGQWWGSLLKYIVFGPIIVFFLFIAGEMALTLFSMGAFGAPPTTAVGDNLSFGSFGGIDGFFANLIPFVIVIIILLSGLSFTSEMGIAGAGMIMGTVKGLAAGGGLIVGGLAAKSIMNKTQRGAGWLSGANKARKQGGIRGPGGLLDYGKKTAKGIPGWKGQFMGGVWDATGGSVKTAYRESKDQVVMAYNKYQEAQRKKAEDRATRLNLNEDDTKERMRQAKSAEEKGGYEDYARKKGYGIIDRSNEDEQQKLLEEAIDRNAPQNELDGIRQELIRIRKQNENTERKIVEISILGGGKKSDIYTSRPDLKADSEASPEVRQTQMEEQLMKMQDEGISQNKINKDSFRSPEFIAAFRKIYGKNDPDKFNQLIDNRSNDVKNNTQTALKELLGDKTNFVVTDTQNGGYDNFQNAASLAFLQKGNVEKIFHGQKEAITDFASHFYKDLGTFDRESLITIAKNIDKTTLARIRPENLNPADAKLIADTIKNTNPATGGRQQRNQSDKDVYAFIMSNEAWGGKRAAPKNTDYEPDDNDVWNNLNNPQPRNPSNRPNPNRPISGGSEETDNLYKKIKDIEQALKKEYEKDDWDEAKTEKLEKERAELAKEFNEKQ